MQEKSESLILSEVFQDVRGLTKFYLSLAKALDPHLQFELNGQKLNTLYWLAGHLTWSQHFLLVEALTGETMGIQWLDRFEMGTILTDEPGLPTFEEILIAMDRVHHHAMASILALDDSGLDAPNHRGIAFQGEDSKRVVIRHAIRHEPCHTGQIGWLLKLHGQETV